MNDNDEQLQMTGDLLFSMEKKTGPSEEIYYEVYITTYSEQNGNEHTKGGQKCLKLLKVVSRMKKHETYYEPVNETTETYYPIICDFNTLSIPGFDNFEAYEKYAEEHKEMFAEKIVLIDDEY